MLSNIVPYYHVSNPYTAQHSVHALIPTCHHIGRPLYRALYATHAHSTLPAIRNRNPAGYRMASSTVLVPVSRAAAMSTL